MCLSQQSDDWDAHFLLINDLDMNEVDGAIKPIGTIVDPFSGTFDGGLCSIRRLSIQARPNDGVGLFGVIAGDEAKLVNLILREVTVEAVSHDHVGALVGQQLNGIIAHCWVINATVTGGEQVGGLVGQAVAVMDCVVQAEVLGNCEVGGLAGCNKGEISNCAVRTEAGFDEMVGGLAGSNQGLISACTVWGQVYGEVNLDALVAVNEGILEDCHSH